MYRPRQPERTEPSRTAPAGRERAPSPGSLLNARRLQPERRQPDVPEAPPPEARPQATPGSLLAASAAAQARAPAPPPPPPASPLPAQQASASSFLPGLAAIGTLGIDDFVAWLRDGWKWIALAVVLCTAAAFAYSLVVTSRYSVYTDIVIDPANLNVVTDDVFTTSPQRDAQLMEVESRLRVLTSRNVYARVIDRLELTEDDEFVQPGALERIKALVGLGGTVEEPGEGGKRVAAMRALSERVQAHREDRSFVVVLRVWSEDPLKAVAISDAIVAAFEEELFSSSAQSAGRVADSLRERLDELRAHVTQAEGRVEEFRRANGLQSANGELVSSQRSAEINTQLVEAQQRLIQAQSVFSQMNAALERGQTASASVFDSEAMTALREQRHRLQQQIGSIERTYGPLHPRMIAAISERDTLDQATVREARRILELARAEATREQASYDALRRKADEEKTNVFADNAAQVQLRELEREARSRAAVYETYLARAQEVSERQQIDTTNVRVISRAVPPQGRDWPPRKIVLLIAGGIAGLMLGTALAIWFGLWRFLRMPRSWHDERRRLLAANA